MNNNSPIANLQYIYPTAVFLQQQSPSILNSKPALYNLLLKTDIKYYIDKEKIQTSIDLSQCNFQQKLTKITNKYIFAQLQGHSNIAEPLHANDNHYDNLDVLEKTESKFLQGDDDKSKKYEKYVWKLELTDGVNVFYGFEYHTFRDLDINQLKNITSDTNKYLKVLLGPNIDVHRGIFYLDSTNFKILG